MEKSWDPFVWSLYDIRVLGLFMQRGMRLLRFDGHPDEDSDNLWILARLRYRRSLVLSDINWYVAVRGDDTVRIREMTDGFEFPDVLDDDGLPPEEISEVLKVVGQWAEQFS